MEKILKNEEGIKNFFFQLRFSIVSQMIFLVWAASIILMENQTFVIYLWKSSFFQSRLHPLAVDNDNKYLLWSLRGLMIIVHGLHQHNLKKVTQQICLYGEVHFELARLLTIARHFTSSITESKIFQRSQE